jgi:hypothetical protein
MFDFVPHQYAMFGQFGQSLYVVWSLFGFQPEDFLGKSSG